MTRTRQSLPWDSHIQQARNRGEYIREASSPLYHTTRWTRLSKMWRASHPLCAECQRNGIIKAAEVVDHVVPWPMCKDFFDTSNLQSLCERCNMEKGNRERAMIQDYKRKNNIK